MANGIGLRRDPEEEERLKRLSQTAMPVTRASEMPVRVSYGVPGTERLIPQPPTDESQRGIGMTANISERVKGPFPTLAATPQGVSERVRGPFPVVSERVKGPFETRTGPIRIWGRGTKFGVGPTPSEAEIAALPEGYQGKAIGAKQVLGTPEAREATLRLATQGITPKAVPTAKAAPKLGLEATLIMEGLKARQAAAQSKAATAKQETRIATAKSRPRQADYYHTVEDIAADGSTVKRRVFDSDAYNADLSAWEQELGRTPTVPRGVGAITPSSATEDWRKYLQG